MGLTGKGLLTYIGGMVVAIKSEQKEQEVFGAISHPARRRMFT